MQGLFNLSLDILEQISALPPHYGNITVNGEMQTIEAVTIPKQVLESLIFHARNDLTVLTVRVVN